MRSKNPYRDDTSYETAYALYKRLISRLSWPESVDLVLLRVTRTIIDVDAATKILQSHPDYTDERMAVALVTHRLLHTNTPHQSADLTSLDQIYKDIFEPTISESLLNDFPLKKIFSE